MNPKYFTAKFNGKCAGGCNGIERGDEVHYVDDVLMHTDCENSEGLREFEEEVGGLEEPEWPTCTSCWLIHRPGVCDL